MSRAGEDVNRRMLRAKDAMDRRYAEPLDVAAVARLALVSPAHFSRTFRQVFGESPHRYLQRRRIERAMVLLRTTCTTTTEICVAVGFTSLGTFSRTFTAVVGESPTAHRARGPLGAAPSCFAMAWLRPAGSPPATTHDAEDSRNGEAAGAPGVLASGTCSPS